MKHKNLEELNASLDYITGSPKEEGILELIVRRPAVDEREVLVEGELSIDEGLVGDTWLNRGNDWIYNQLVECAQRMEGLATHHSKDKVSANTRRALNQCARELLLAQSSDWPFLITNGTSAEYATRRVRDHVSRFHYLADAIEQKDIDEEYLSGVEYVDKIFPNADYGHYRNPRNGS